MGNMLVMYPELFGAIVCQVPLLDMLRYHKLLAGASWMGEYGNPDDPKEAEWLRRYSPYHNVQPGVEVPEGAVHDVDARRPRAPRPRAQDDGAMMEQGHDVLYYENIEGRPRRCGRQQAGGVHGGAVLHVLVAEPTQGRRPQHGQPKQASPAGQPSKRGRPEATRNSLQAPAEVRENMAERGGFEPP
jgi:hypothetical protein